MASTILDLYVAYGQRRGSDPLHWILSAVPRGSDRCTYYHVTGGPAQGTSYQLKIEAGKRVNSFGIATKTSIGSINEQDVNKLKASAQRVPPKYCQSWLVEVLQDLEHKQLLPDGTAATWAGEMEPNPYE